MDFWLRISASMMLILCCPAMLQSSPPQTERVEIDRMLAAVNGKVLTEGDLKLARMHNALLSFGEAGAIGQRRDEIDRLIDLELMRQELANFVVGPVDQDLIQKRMETLVQGYAEIGGLPSLLKMLGLRLEELESYIELQTLIVRFVNLRFRPFVNVQDGEIESHYEAILLPKLRESGIGAPALDEVRARIRQILVEEKVNGALERWLANIRSHSRIQIFSEASGDRRP